MRVETLLPMMNYNPNASAVQRQPAAPPPSPNSGVQGCFAGFGRNISQAVSPTTGHPAQAYAPAMTFPLTPTNPGRYTGNIITGMPQEYMMSPARSSRKSYGSPAANQDTILSIEDLAKMGVHLMPPPVVVTQSPFQASEYSGGYGNLPPPLANGSRGHASQGFVPGGTLKTGPTTGLSPVNEASGMQWELGGMPQPSFQEAFSQRTTQSPTRSAFYAEVGITDKENVAMSSTYRGITPASDSIKAMSAQPAMIAPPPGLSLLG